MVRKGDWEASVAFDYMLGEKMMVTLSAEPAEGYRFVAWHRDDFDVAIPDSPRCKYQLCPRPSCRVGRERTHHRRRISPRSLEKSLRMRLRRHDGRHHQACLPHDRR